MLGGLGSMGMGIMGGQGMGMGGQGMYPPNMGGYQNNPTLYQNYGQGLYNQRPTVNTTGMQFFNSISNPNRVNQ